MDETPCGKPHKQGRVKLLGDFSWLKAGTVVEADLETSGKSLQMKSLHPLFQVSQPSLSLAWDDFYDVSADGSRFLVVQSTDPNVSRSIGLLMNLQAKLKGKG